jgi:hypothetical protein
VPVVGLASPVRKVPPAGGGARYFKEKGHNLAGLFLAFWTTYGGLSTFGYPRTEAFRDHGQQMQYTDRALLVLGGGTVTTAPLGRVLTAGREHEAAFQRGAPIPNTPTQRYFPSTGHSLTGRFLTYWLSHHGPEVLGAPIAAPTMETNGDGSGRTYLVQWCENARLEYHPENIGSDGGRYIVELGLLGKQDLQRRGWVP